MQTAHEIVSMMRDVAPAGRERLSPASQRRLRDLTGSLAAVRPGARQEHARFLATGQRSMDLPSAELDAWLRGRRVLVTGGTGCIGSALMALIARRCPGRLVSVSRGVTGGRARCAGADYAQADIRDPRGLAAVFGEVRPDVVFHVAAQRDPGLAERDVHRTVTTNVFGTRNLIAAAAGSGVSQVVCASTGKALRPYSPDVYTASKRAGEWLLSRAAARGGRAYSAGRFTHIMDNSIIYAKLLRWCEGGVIRLHNPDIAFYVQSALEAAQLLLLAGLGADPGALRVHAITDLGWPVNLLDLALGVRERSGSCAPVYFSGYDRGYESQPFPGLYDPLTAGEVSPLLSGFEANLAERAPGGMADVFPLRTAPASAPDERLRALEEVCGRTREPAQVRAALDELSWSLLDATLGAVPRQALVRTAQLTAPHEDSLSPEHERMLDAIRRHAGPVNLRWREFPGSRAPAGQLVSADGERARRAIS